MPPVPAIRDDVGALNEIDHFLRARLQQEGLHPAPPADRRTVLTANSISAGGPGVSVVADKEQDTTVMGEFEAMVNSIRLH